jgi:hypothetical protein
MACTGRFLYPCIIFSLLANGCGPTAASTFPVEGQVTLDGKSLESGEVYFVVPGKTPLIFAIKDGAFNGMAPAGSYRVEICAYRPRQTPVGMPGEKMPDTPENYIPSRFNTQSELSATVEASKQNSVQFTLTEK